MRLLLFKRKSKHFIGLTKNTCSLMHNVTNKKYVPWGNSAAGVASPSFSSAFSASMCSRTAGAHRFLKPIHLKKCYWKFNIFYIDIALNSNLVPHWFFYLWNFVAYLIRYMLDMKNKNTLRKIERRFIQKIMNNWTSS